MFLSVSTKVPAKFVPKPANKIFGYFQRPSISTTKSTSTSQNCRRWNASAPNFGKGKYAKRGPRWGWPTEVALTAVTAILAYGLAAKSLERKHVMGRAYSNPEKFKEPKYASITDMEDVSDQKSKFPAFHALLEHCIPNISVI